MKILICYLSRNITNKLKIFTLVFIYVTLLSDVNFKKLAVIAGTPINIDLKEEINNGNLLIGIKQYLGDKKYQTNPTDLIFDTENKFLMLSASNGINNKSKKIKILFKKIPLENPRIVERLVSPPYASYESAQKAATRLRKKNLNPIIANPNNWVLWLPKSDKKFVSGQFKLQKEIFKYEIIPYIENEYIFKKLDGPIHINSNENIKINNVNYGKDFYLVRDSYGSWTLIQKISLDDYLEGVLPHEIGINAPIEALKAQAVIARTWAIYNSDRFKTDHYHLCVTTQCQVFKPSKENINVRKAVRETSNLILTFQNKPINAFYHATNGGISANASESWSIKDYPYLIANSDLISQSQANNRYKIQDATDLKDFLKIDRNKFYGSDHYLFRWQKNISSNQLKKYLEKYSDSKLVNKILGFKVIDRGLSGRVTKLEIVQNNTKDSILLIKDDIRRYLTFLPSNLFIINKLNDNLWVFSGGGFGHGVGLSQSGAIQMAKFGLSYEKILEHYYLGTEIQNIDNLTK